MIDPATLNRDDIGRIALVVSPLTGQQVEMVITSYERGPLDAGLIYVAALNTPDPRPTPLYGAVVTRTERRAVQVYRYGLARRPLQMGAQPRGFLINPGLLNKEPDHSNPGHRFGFLDYPERLSDEDVKGYELTAFGRMWVESE
jgi:hypothetical protein